MKQRQILSLLCISLPICVLLRIMQIFFTIDSSNGFIRKPFATLGTLISIIVVVTIAAVSLLSLATKTVAKKQSGNFVGSAAALTALSFAARAIIGALSTNKSGIGALLITFFALLSAVSFGMLFMREIKGFNMPQIILVIPVIYYVAQLISVFVNSSSVALVTENVFLIFSTCAMLLFLYGFAAYENKIGDISKKPNRLFACAVAAVMFCSVSTEPRLILALFSKIEMSTLDVANTVVDLTTGIFIAVYALCNFACKYGGEKRGSKHSA